jgi:hypothetical protein
MLAAQGDEALQSLAESITKQVQGHVCLEEFFSSKFKLGTDRFEAAPDVMEMMKAIMSFKGEIDKSIVEASIVAKRRRGNEWGVARGNRRSEDAQMNSVKRKLFVHCGLETPVKATEETPGDAVPLADAEPGVVVPSVAASEALVPVEPEQEPTKKAMGKQIMIPINQKCMVVQYVKDLLQNGGEFDSVERTVAEKFPKLLGSGNVKCGYKKGMLSRWVKQYDSERWDLIPWSELSVATKTTMKAVCFA